MHFRTFFAALIVAFPSLTNAWEITKFNTEVGALLIAVERQDGWQAEFSKMNDHVIWCFQGPYIVKGGSNYDIQVKAGSGPWFSVPVEAHDDKTLCTLPKDAKKSMGLFATLVTHGGFSVGQNVSGKFVSATFKGDDIKDRIGW